MIRAGRHTPLLGNPQLPFPGLLTVKRSPGRLPPFTLGGKGIAPAPQDSQQGVSPSSSQGMHRGRRQAEHQRPVGSPQREHGGVSAYLGPVVGKVAIWRRRTSRKKAAAKRPLLYPVDRVAHTR